MSPYPPPLTTLSHPPHFSSHDQLMYDPLYISASSIPQLLQSSPPDSLVTLAIFQMTSPVLGGDPGKLGTFEGEENEALVVFWSLSCVPNSNAMYPIISIIILYIHIQ